MLLGSNQRVEEDVVKKVNYVDYTSTWHPMHHSVIVRVLESATKAVGLDIVDREYSLSKDGADMFGVWNFRGSNKDRDWSLGFRNSMKKSFAFGGCAGNRVLVCDNMCFSGDMVSHRRHTSGLNRDQMQEIAHSLVHYIVDQCQDFDNWFDKLQEVSIEKQYDSIVLDALRGGIIPVKSLGKFEEAFQEELKVNGGSGTVADFHGSITRLLREGSLFSVQERSEPLNDYCKKIVDMVSDGDAYVAQYLKK